jgi:hypothetical protein
MPSDASATNGNAGTDNAMGTTTNLQIVLTTDGEGNVTAALGGLVGKIKEIKPASEEASGGIEKMSKSIETIKHLMEAWGVYEILKETIGKILEANAEMQRLQATLIAVTGSLSEAKAVYGELSEIAQNTTATTAQLVDSYVRLKNAGIEPNAQLLSSLANIAVGTGRTVDQVANAMAGAFEGNERILKQLGITAQAAGDQIVLSFQGQQVVVENSAKGWADFFNTFGQSEQFIAAQQASVNSLGGAWHQFWKTLEDDATTGNGLIGGTVSYLTQLIQKANQLAKPGDPAQAGYQQGLHQQGYANDDSGLFHVGIKAPTFDQFKPQYDANIAALKQIASETGLTNASTEIYNATLGRLADTMREVRAEEQAGAASQQAAVADMALATAAADKLTQKLHEQTDGLGGSVAAMIKARTTTGDLAVAEDTAKERLLAAARAYDAKQASVKAAAEYERQLAADSTYLDRLQKEMDAVGQTTDYQIILNAQLAASKAANEEDAAAILKRADALYSAKEALSELVQLEKEHKQDESDNEDEIQRILDVREALKQVNDELDPAAAAWDKYIKTMNTLADAEQTLGPDFQDLIDKLKGAAKAQLDLASNPSAKAWEQTWTQAAGDVAGVLGDVMVNGFEGAGKKVLSEAQTLAKQLIDFWLKQKIIIPLQQKANGTGDGPSGQDLMQGGAFAVGSIGGAAVGGQGQNAQLGASIGALIGSNWGPIGSMIGGLIGGAFGGLFDSTKTPTYSISGNGAHDGGGSTFHDDLGTFGISGKHVNNDMTNQVEQKIEAFDDALAALLPPDLVDQVRARIASINTTFTGSDPSAVEKAHLDAVVQAVMPAFAAFINGISGVQNELQAFTSLRKLQDDLKSTASTITQLTGSPLEKLQDQLKTLGQKVFDAQSQLASALKTGDPTQILAAEQTLKAAVAARYQAEIQNVQNLLQAEQSLEQAGYTLNESLAQKIAQLTGDWSGAADTAAARISDLQAEITSDLDFGDALNKVQALSAAVNDWLSAAIEQVHSQFDSQIQALEDEKAAAQAAQQNAGAVAQAIQQAMDEARQAEIAALQKQLAIAEQWLSVLNDANKLVQDLQTGSTNPLGGFSQLDLLNQIIQQKFAAMSSDTGAAKANDASALLADLQQRLQLIQSGNLYDRSSPEYLGAYNATLAQIAQIQALAGPEANKVDKLQAQIDALQAIKASISGGFSSSSSYLDSINEQEKQLKAQEQKQIDELNKQAAEYYKWEQTQAQELEEKRHKEIVDQLNAITGGVDPTQFIAEESGRMADSLDSIDKQISDFLDSISGGAYSGHGTGTTGGSIGPAGGGGGGGGGGDNNPHSTNVPVTINASIVVNGTGMGAQDIAAAVGDHLDSNLGAIANRLKRELKVA